MQGAAWKLTALAASLAVGFFGLMQVQQKLSPKPEQLFSEDDSSLMPDEESTESRMFGKDDFAVNEQQNEPREDPFFRAEPVNGSNPQPVKDGFVPVTQRKETAADPFENRTTAQHAPQPTPENDPFAGYQPPAQEMVDQFQNQVQQANAQVQTAMNETAQKGEQLVDDWQGKILQTANEVREDLNKVRNAFDPFTAQAEPPQNDGPAEQERPDGPFPVINPAVEMQPPQQIPQIELTLNSKRTPRPGSAPTPKSDAPAPFFANETEAKPIQITPAPAMDETPAADPFTTTADLPQVTPQPAAVKPVASSEAQPAALQLTPPATSNTPAPAPEVQPETNTPAPASGNPFFPEFSNTTPQEMKENQDEPYRLVPQFNNAQPESTPAPEPATNTEPAPFALTPPDNAPVMESEPANPFSASEPIQPEESLPVIEPQPIPQVQPEPTPAPANPAPPFSFSPTPEPEPTPAPAPFQLQPEPAPSPGTARIQITPAPLKVEENNAPTDEMLIGSARVEHEATETAMQPKVVLNKSAPDNAVLGQPLIYSIEIENTGDVAVKEVRVEDKFPAGTRLTGTIPRAELVEKTLVWKFDELKPSERKKILVRVVPIESGKVGSVSTVSYKSVVTTQTMVTAPKLELTLLSTNEVAIGEPVEVKFVVKNSGAGVASDVILRNLIPKGLEHPAGADLEYEIGSLQGGEEKEVQLTMIARATGEQENVASIKSSNGVTAEAKAKVNVIESILSVSHAGPTRRFVGHAAKYVTTVRNNSNRQLSGITVLAHVPAGFNFSTADGSGQFNGEQRTIIWKLSGMAPQEEIVLNSELIPTQVGTQTLLVQTMEASGHEAEVTTAVKIEGFPSLAVRIPDVRGPAAIGERVSLKFKIVNRGSSEATQVAIQCHIPEQLEFISANGPVVGVQQGNVVQFQPLGRLMPNQEAEFDLVFNAKSKGDGRVEFEVQAAQITTPLKHQEQVVVYGD